MRTRKPRLPNVDDVYDRLLECRNDLREDTEAGWRDDDELDVRLQLRSSGAWDIHTGSACYDTDHRGHWGAGYLYADNTDSEVYDLANELVCEVSEDLAQDDSYDGPEWDHNGKPGEQIDFDCDEEWPEGVAQ